MSILERWRRWAEYQRDLERLNELPQAPRVPRHVLAVAVAAACALWLPLACVFAVDTGPWEMLIIPPALVLCVLYLTLISWLPMFDRAGCLMTVFLLALTVWMALMGVPGAYVLASGVLGALLAAVAAVLPLVILLAVLMLWRYGRLDGLQRRREHG